MADANLRAVQQGQPARPSFRADRYHTEVTIQNLLTQGGLVSGIGKRLPQPSIVYVLNNTGAVLTQFSAIGLGTPACLPTDNLNQFNRQILFNALATGATQYGVCLDSIQNGCCGRVVVSGVVQAIGDVPNASVLWTDGAPGGYRIVQLGAGGSWNGIVIFKSLSGQQATPTGTPTQFILIHKSDSLKGTVEYSAGTNEQSWLPGTEEWRVSNLPSGAYACE